MNAAHGLALLAGIAAAACGGHPHAHRARSSRWFTSSALVVPDDATDRDRIAAAVLRRFLADPETMPDVSLVPHRGEIVVANDGLDVPLQISGRVGDQPLVPRTVRDVQAEVDRTKKARPVIRFFSIEVTGDRATVRYGADVIDPTEPRRFRLCCCVAVDHYLRRGAAWVFERRDAERCS